MLLTTRSYSLGQPQKPPGDSVDNSCTCLWLHFSGCCVSWLEDFLWPQEHVISTRGRQQWWGKVASEATLNHWGVGIHSLFYKETILRDVLHHVSDGSWSVRAPVTHSLYPLINTLLIGSFSFSALLSHAFFVPPWITSQINEWHPNLCHMIDILGEYKLRQSHTNFHYHVSALCCNYFFCVFQIAPPRISTVWYLFILSAWQIVDPL